MGNCLGSCFGSIRRRSKINYFRGQYKEYNVGIEFESLIEDELSQQSELATVTDRERDHLLNKRYSDLIRDQKKRDAEIDAELKKQEENIRLEEEAYIAAKREAARAVNQTRALDQQRSKPVHVANGVSKSWLGDNKNEWNVAEDDFETFLESVKARSQSVRGNGMVPNVYSSTGDASPYSCPASGSVGYQGASGGSVSTQEASTQQMEWDPDFEPEFVMDEVIQEQVLTGETKQLTEKYTANAALQSYQSQAVPMQGDDNYSTLHIPTSKFGVGSEVFNDLTQSVTVQFDKGLDSKNIVIVSSPTQSNGNQTSTAHTSTTTTTDKPVATDVDPFDFDKFLEELDLEE